jgi:hypothetical protein
VIIKSYVEWDIGDNAEPIQPKVITPEQEDIEADTYDELLLTEPLLEHNGTSVRAYIVGRKWDVNGHLIGYYNHNPILNTRVYI